jgi:hypothetical protein
MNDKILYGTLIHDILLNKNLGVNEITYFKGIFAPLFFSHNVARNRKTNNNLIVNSTTTSSF